MGEVMIEDTDNLPNAKMRAFSAKLQDGGPPVNYALIAQSVAGVLASDVEETVQHLAGMYRPWFREYSACYINSLPDAEWREEPLSQDKLDTPEAPKNTVHNRIAKYFEMGDDERLACYGEVGTRGDGTPLNPYIIELAELIRDEWDWEDRREQPEYESKEAQAEALYEFLSGQELDIPFPLDLIAVELVDMGLDELCGIED